MDRMDMKAVVSEFEELLVQVGISKRSAAKRLGISSDHLSRVMNGHLIPSVDLFERIQDLSKKLKRSGLAAS
jgi:transcriptional regulator with XRE-family HTH domain